MLVLTRKEGQALEISGSGVLRIVLVRVQGGQARLGFEQQDGKLLVLREELVIKGQGDKHDG